MKIKQGLFVIVYKTKKRRRRRRRKQKKDATERKGKITKKNCVKQMERERFWKGLFFQIKNKVSTMTESIQAFMFNLRFLLKTFISKSP